MSYKINNSLKKIILFLTAFVAVAAFAITTANKISANSTPQYSAAYKEAKKHLGSSYRYGAVGPVHFDCSGFTKYVFKKGAHTTIPRTARAQYKATKKVSKSNVKKGDLVYFGSRASSISHVGFYVGNGKMIDSQNRGIVTEKVYAPWWHVVGFSRPVSFDYAN